MPFEHEIALSPRIAQLTAYGDPDITEWRSAIRALVRDPELPRDASILCDLREVSMLPETQSGRPFSAELLDRLPNRPLALVVRAAAAQSLARQIPPTDRQEIQVFTEYRTALQWLVLQASTHA